MAVAFDESHLGRFRVKRGLGGSGQREVAPGRALRSPPHTRKSGERGGGGPGWRGGGSTRPQTPAAPSSCRGVQVCASGHERARRSSLLWKFWEFPLKSGSPFIRAPSPLIPA